MTALAATDVTITLAAQNVDVMPGMKRVCLPTIAFGDGALTYPTGGVPLPVIGNFGMKRELQRLLIQQPAGNLYTYKYDPDNHKIKIFLETAGVLAEMGNAVAPAAVSLPCLAIGE